MQDHTNCTIAEITSTDELDMIQKARDVTESLSRHYPNHLWMVGWAYGNILVVKNAAVSHKYGFTIDAANSYSSSQLSHAAVMAGGELLERCGMKRGAWDGQFAEKLEGSDERFFKPHNNS